MQKRALQETGTIAIARGMDYDRLAPLLKALYDGGIRLTEVTLNSPDALHSIHRLRGEWEGRMCIGAGTVTSLQEVKLAVEAGAQFIVTPNYAPPVVEYCLNAGLLITPGVFTPTEMAAALQQGCEYVKLFPAKTLGPGYIKDLLAPFDKAKIIAVGGVSAGNAADYYSAGAAGLGVGGSLCKKPQNGDWEEVSRIAAQLVTAYKTAKRMALHHSVCQKIRSQP